jgi:DNA mismatch repair protein MutS
MTGLSPMLADFKSYKSRFPGFIVFYQVGDFYETFFEDAYTVADELKIALTTRDKRHPNPVPMCGVPVSSLDSHLPKLLDKGYSVVVISQNSSQQQRSGLVERFVDKILTPSIRVDLKDDSQFFVASVDSHQDQFRVFFTNIISKAIYNVDLYSPVETVNFLLSLNIKELLISKEASTNQTFLTLARNYFSNIIKEVDEEAQKALLEYIASILEEKSINWQIEKLSGPAFINSSSLQSLNILSKGDEENLFNLLNKTTTKMGEEMLLRRFMSPFVKEHEILTSLDQIQSCLQNWSDCLKIKKILKPLRGLQKITFRLQTKKISSPELCELKNAVNSALLLKDLKTQALPDLMSALSQVSPSLELIQKLLAPLNTESSKQSNDPDLFLPGFFPDLDSATSLKKQSNQAIQLIEDQERAKTGINNLKVKETQNFGLVIEITNANKHLVPPHYIRKQTLVNCERYTTEQLLELESKLSYIDQEIERLNREKLHHIIESLLEHAKTLEQLSQIIGSIDVQLSLAEASLENDFCRPNLGEPATLEIEEGFHPILKKILKSSYQTNSFKISVDNRAFLITGPNMGGKSTFLRQIGLTVFMFHLGCYVPAKKATIGLFENILTRIGAEDFIFKGLSTFMVEALELASIFNNFSPNSLVLIDELGRGTSTKEAVALSLGALRELNRKKSAFLFSTHLFEIVELADMDVKLLKFEILNNDGNLIFTHRLQEGFIDHSFALEVCKLAGLNETVLKSAKSFLDCNTKDKTATSKTSETEISSISDIEEKLLALDLNRITPLEALNLLEQLKQEILSKKAPRKVANF